MDIPQPKSIWEELGCHFWSYFCIWYWRNYEFCEWKYKIYRGQRWLVSDSRLDLNWLRAGDVTNTTGIPPSDLSGASTMHGGGIDKDLVSLFPLDMWRRAESSLSTLWQSCRDAPSKYAKTHLRTSELLRRRAQELSSGIWHAYRLGELNSPLQTRWVSWSWVALTIVHLDTPVFPMSIHYKF